MGKQTYSFHEARCSACEKLIKSYPSNYCNGFKKRKNPRRFTARDPKLKAPKWCPKRLDPSILRVYRAKDEYSEFRVMDDIQRNNDGNLQYAVPYKGHYFLTFEFHSGITAKEFFKASADKSWTELYGYKINAGDVIEIDSGLGQHYFQYQGWRGFKPAIFTPPGKE